MENNVANSSQQCDCFVIGAGLVGLATAYQLLKADPELKVIVCSSIHVINAPLPAATACFSIGRTIAAKAISRIK